MKSAFRLAPLLLTLLAAPAFANDTMAELKTGGLTFVRTPDVEMTKEALFISPETVKKHTGNIYGKLGVRGRTGAIARSRELSLLD